MRDNQQQSALNRSSALGAERVVRVWAAGFALPLAEQEWEERKNAPDVHPFSVKKLRPTGIGRQATKSVCTPTVPDFYKYTGALTPASTISRKRRSHVFARAAPFSRPGMPSGELRSRTAKRDVAMAIYKESDKSQNGRTAIPSSSYWLAQNRIKATASEGNGVRAESR